MEHIEVNNMAHISVRVEEKMKNEAEALLNDMGLTMTSAVNMFLAKLVREKRIPFDITAFDQTKVSDHQEQEDNGKQNSDA